MKFYKIVFCLLLAMASFGIAHAAMASPSTGTKTLDLSKWHNVGNIWLRVSNYGFFGSGDDVVPQYPSLEYPGGSGIDYLYQAALWFGAKKYRRNDLGQQLYWRALNPSADSTGTVPYGSPDWRPWMKPVIDTLVTVGFDGDYDLYEFLPAYNPLEASSTDELVQHYYGLYDDADRIATASIRHQKRGEDDDGDGIIDEDFVGYTFRLRDEGLPDVFEQFRGKFIHETRLFNYETITTGDNSELWYPLGFMDLSDKSHVTYDFANPYDDDGDGLIDEDGAPVSEQDFISYYYDYSPFGTPGDRDLGGSRSRSTHVPIGVRVRQMSYQWSYEYIKNLVYVEFNITNMNTDTLYDCAMGIYMDCDCGPQTMGPEKAADDKSGYVKGEGYEFAYTYDADGDGGLTTGMVGARVCTPDPEDLEFACWYWKVGDGPNDDNPLSFNYAPRLTANEKYWLLTGRNPDSSKYASLRPEEPTVMEYEQVEANDTRFLFAFYGDMHGLSNPTENSWNLEPGRTMKIVVAVFPGDNLEDLKGSATWARDIYDNPQKLHDVVLPDTMPHYKPPEPPEIPKLYAEIKENGNSIDVYWDNRSEFTKDFKNVSGSDLGWQYPPTSPDYAGMDSDPDVIDWQNFPPEFQMPALSDTTLFNNNAIVNPFTAHRLRHDFQGYTLWGRSGSGSREDWEMIQRWDKIDTQRDKDDYVVNWGHPKAKNFGGYQGIDTGLPNLSIPPAFENALGHNTGMPYDETEFAKYKRLDENYYYYINTHPDHPVHDFKVFYGFPLYKPGVDHASALSEANRIATEYAELPDAIIKKLQARIFKNPDVRDDVYDELADYRLIPLPGFGGGIADTPDELVELENKRLSRRYYKQTIQSPRKGIEYYVAVTAFDRGVPERDLNFLETGRDADANMKVFFPGATAQTNMDNIYVVPNPYIGRSKFDGRREKDEKGDKSRRLWFVNLPENCTIRIYTLAGDLVDTIEHRGAYMADVITVSKSTKFGLAPGGMHDWNLLSKNNQIIAPGVYLYSVENKADNKIKVGKFVIIK